jgi:hypothetical protein
MEVPRFDDGQTGLVFGDHLHPRGRIGFHQSVGNEDAVHAIQHGRQHGVPETYFPLNKRKKKTKEKKQKREFMTRFNFHFHPIDATNLKIQNANDHFALCVGTGGC